MVYCDVFFQLLLYDQKLVYGYQQVSLLVVLNSSSILYRVTRMNDFPSRCTESK